MRDWSRLPKTFYRAFIKQDDRVCDVCEKRFLSGYAQIERGYCIRVICNDCNATGREPTLGEVLSRPSKKSQSA